ncbi:hypothetical protein CBFG_02611 [Clostridiales bacterium 1_7_47FAA]|nr:hypothetical protein CBFG_02611 [Clostridiales bacterium 1_7_47FAA]
MVFLYKKKRKSLTILGILLKHGINQTIFMHIRKCMKRQMKGEIECQYR